MVCDRGNRRAVDLTRVAELGVVALLERELLQPVAQASERDPEQLRSLRSLTDGAFEGFDDQAPLDLAEDVVEIAPLGRERDERRRRARCGAAHLTR